MLHSLQYIVRTVWMLR